MTKKRISIIVCLITISLGILIVYSKVQADSNVFTSEKWSGEIYKRDMMLDNLLNKYDLHGMTHDDVIKLLGRNGIVHNDADLVSYVIGKGYIDPVIFTITFDKSGKVKAFSTTK